MKLICCVGLPGSGKTTWAKEQITKDRTEQRQGNPRMVRVNRDEIRISLGLKDWATWDWQREPEVTVIEDNQLHGALSQPDARVVICDDTNLSADVRRRLEHIAVEHGAAFEIKRFDVPLEECIKRDAARVFLKVGEKQIRIMAAKYGLLADTNADYPGLVVYTAPIRTWQRPTIICDLDGTLSLFKAKGHRGPYDATACDQDDVNYTVRHMLETYYRFMDYQIVYLSGREEKYLEPTNTFFRKNHIPPGDLLMRATGDTRKDWLVKYELFDAHLRNRDIRLVLDDRDQVVKMWRQIGLPCWQVAEGRF